MLSIDGGGMRGIIPALVLEEMEKRSGRPAADLFDLMVGTSTGGLLALGLSKPKPGSPDSSQYSAKQLVDLYEKEGERIFPALFAGNLRRILGPKFPPSGLEAVLDRYFGDTYFLEARTNVQVLAYEIEDRRHFSFLTWHDRFRHVYMREVAQAATAAPTYFPPVRIPMYRSDYPKGYVALIDGAVYANNPSPYALAAAKSRTRRTDTVFLVSLGTGAVSVPMPFGKAWGWGIWGWSEPLLNIVFSDPGVDEELHHILPLGSYVRLQPTLVRHSGLDDADIVNVQALKRLTETFIRAHSMGLGKMVSRLTLPRPPDCQSLPGLKDRPAPARMNGPSNARQ
ncbi:MAG TPA: patatin-like phospholipase family protein [Candidatus Bathyarchaeia archaeon]|nr:patatin-like phospholipase family protein [Candidatus Bathyarchaeia archaeon]